MNYGIINAISIESHIKYLTIEKLRYIGSQSGACVLFTFERYRKILALSYDFHFDI